MNFENKFQIEFDSKATLLSSILDSPKFVAYHCTRLTAAEVIHINNLGLEPLSTELIEIKLKRVFENNLLNDKEYKFLLNHNLSNQQNRSGRIWFILDSELLKRPNSVRSFFEFWGGESCFFDLDENSPIKKKLRTIGVPYIVEVLLGEEELNSRESISVMMCKYWIRERHGTEVFPSLFDVKINTSKKVSRLFSFENKEFEELTNYSTWSAKNLNKTLINKT